MLRYRYTAVARLFLLKDIIAIVDYLPLLVLNYKFSYTYTYTHYSEVYHNIQKKIILLTLL